MASVIGQSVGIHVTDVSQQRCKSPSAGLPLLFQRMGVRSGAEEGRSDWQSYHVYRRVFWPV